MGYLRGLDHLWVLVSAKGSAVPKMQETTALFSYSHHYSHLHTEKEKNSDVSHPSKDM